MHQIGIMILENWEIDEQINIEGEELTLRGGAVRSVFVLKPYVLAFYSNVQFNHYSEVLEDASPKNIELIVNSDMITTSMIIMGLKEGLDRTAFGKMPDVRDKAKDMFDAFEKVDVKKGDRIDLFQKDAATIIIRKNGVIEHEAHGENLVKAVYGIWFSKSFDSKMRDKLLMI